jgi:hypothetical protein
MPEPGGYILRIGDEQWVRRVFDMAIYYSNLNRKWSRGETVLFVHKTPFGDAFVGYGAIAQTKQKRYLSQEEKAECERGGWKRAIEFQYVVRFEKPLLIKETVLAKSRLRGRFFHGLKLQPEQVRNILTQAEDLSSHQKS